MRSNSFLMAAMEQLYGADAPLDTTPGQPVAPVASVVSPDSPDEVDTAAALAETQQENEELSQELIDSETENEQAFVETTSEDVTRLETAIEALAELGETVKATMAANHFSPYANAGFAMALESICSNVCIRDASLVAATESTALMVSENPSTDDVEKAKTGGIFATIREKAKQIWKALVGMAKRIAARIKSVKATIDVMFMIQKADGYLRQVNNLDASDVKGMMIRDEAFCKRVRVPSNDNINRVMMNTTLTTSKAIVYVRDYSKTVKGVLASIAEAGNEGKRQDAQNSVWRMTTELGKIISNGFGDNSTEIDSGKLACGIVLKMEREKRPDALPSVNVSYDIEDQDYANEVHLASRFDAQLFTNFISDLNGSNGKNREELNNAMKGISDNVPKGWGNPEKLKDMQMYSAAALGFVSKHTMQLFNLIDSLLIPRIFWAYIQWFKLTLEVYRKEGDPENVAAA